MNVVIIDGYLGAGKTLAMSLLASYFQSLSGCTLYSNYGLYDSKPFKNFDDFYDVAMQPSSIICLDEAHADLDARNFNTNQVKFFTHVVFYLRKIRTTMFLATPTIDNLDSRVRAICNLYCKVTKTKTHFKYDMYDMQAGLFLRQYKIAKDDAFMIARGLYNTYNIVTPLEYPSDREAFQNFIEKLKVVSDEYYIGQGVGKLTPSAVPEAVPIGGF